MDFSVIICTCNRARSLAKTLESVAKLRLLPGKSHELIIVDNASTDDTAAVVKTANVGALPVRYVYEARKGLSCARNRGLKEAQGNIILFTDDDVELPENWIEAMSRPLLDDTADVITGGVKLAPYLDRPWMTPMHRTWLACTTPTDFEIPAPIVGANMALKRSVLEQIPFFDEELGAGALGFGEETLVSMQLEKAGLRLRSLTRDLFVIHHPEASRLGRASLLNTAIKHGRSHAYLAHHWHHETIPWRALKLSYLRAKLFARRLVQSPQRQAEGCPAWEMSYLVQLEKYRQFGTEMGRPRNYQRHGLRKLSA